MLKNVHKPQHEFCKKEVLIAKKRVILVTERKRPD